MPLRPAASSLADTPSTMKLFEKLRWLPTEIPLPGTAEVSAKSCVLAMLVGDTPGTSRPRSRKLRPFMGSALASTADTVPAIWLRAVSRTERVAGDGDGVLEAADLERDRAAGTRSRRSGRASGSPLLKPCLPTRSSYGPIFRNGKRKRPSESVAGGGRDVRLQVTRRDVRLRHRGTLWVDHAPGDARVVDRLLAPGADGRPRREREQERLQRLPHSQLSRDEARSLGGDAASLSCGRLDRSAASCRRRLIVSAGLDTYAFDTYICRRRRRHG